MKPAQAGLFDTPEPEPAALDYRSALLEQIRRDTAAIAEGWHPGPEFYRARIEAYRAEFLSLR